MSSFSALKELLKVLNQVITWFHQFSSIVTYLSVENFHSCNVSMRAFNGHHRTIQGGPKVTSQRFELFAWPLIIGSAKFVQECAGTVTGSRNI